MNSEIKEILSKDDYRTLIQIAEDVGNNLGIVRAQKVVQIYRLINAELKNLKYGSSNKQDYTRLLLLKPKIVHKDTTCSSWKY
jgi:hypothetical protein